MVFVFSMLTLLLLYGQETTTTKNRTRHLIKTTAEKIKKYGEIRITIIRNNTKASVGIP